MSELIDRNALIEKLDGIWDCNDMVFEPDDCCDISSDCKSCKWRETKEAIKRIVLHMATIEAVPVRHGEWKEWDDGDNTWSCSVCGNPFVLIDGTPSGNEMKYCPNCGARMDGGRTNNERSDQKD